MHRDALTKIPVVLFQYRASRDGSETFAYDESVLTKRLGLKSSSGTDYLESFLDALTPQSRASFRQALLKANESPDFQWSGEITVAGGRVLQAEASGSCEKDTQGNFTIHGFLIESQKQGVIQNLEEEKTILNNVLANIPHSVFWKDVNSVYLGCNERFLKDANVGTKADVVGKTDFDMPWATANAESYRRYDAELMQAGRSILNLEETQLQADGSQTHVITSKVPLLDKGGRTFGILGIYMDVTEHYMTRQRLNDNQERMHATAKMAALGEMAAGIAHEINNPVAIIAALCEEAGSALTNQNLDLPAARESLATIDATLDRISKIVSGLSSIARHGKGDATTTVILADLLAEIHELCRERFRRHGIDLSVTLPPATFAFTGRATELAQVLLNLLNNSFDAVQALKERWVSIECKNNGDRIEILVSDSGYGIPASVQEKMFQPFYTTKQVGKGTGLGLAISSGLVLAMGGELKLNAKAERTQFTISLPAVKTAA